MGTNTKTIVQYVTYALSVVALLSLVVSATWQVGVLVVSALVNILYVNKK